MSEIADHYFQHLRPSLGAKTRSHMMDIDLEQAQVASNVDDWFACFSPATGSGPNAFPFTAHKIQSIESRRARMSDLLIFDVLLIRGGIRSPDMLFPPADWTTLRRLLDAIDESAYDILKKDCLVYILLKWAWDTDSRETNPAWDTRYIQDRCIAPQFVSLADAYWLLDTGTNLCKAVSILSDARLNRDYVSKILQAISLSPTPAALVVKYVRAAKPLITEPDDIDLYALSLAQLSFMDAWAYQRSFPERSNTRERLLAKIINWCLMPTPKQEALVQLLAFPLSSYEMSSLHTFALPSQFTMPSSLVNTNSTSTSIGPVLSSQAMLILQDLLCVRAIQSGDYVQAIRLDRQYFSVSSSLGSGTSSSIPSQTGRESIDRKLIIQGLFAALPPAERTLLEDELGKVAIGIRADTSLMQTPRQGAARRPLTTESSLTASWEDVGASMGTPVPSTPVSRPSSVVGTGKATPTLVSTISRPSQPMLSTSTSASQPSFGRQVPPTPKFTAFGSPIPPTSVSMTRGVISERGKTLFSTSVVGGVGAVAKSAARTSLFETAGSAKNAPNAFYKPPPAQGGRTSLDLAGVLGSSSTAKNAGQDINVPKQNGVEQGEESGGEDVSMGSGSDAEIIEEDHRDELEAEFKVDDESTENFVTRDKTHAIDLTLHAHRADDVMEEDHGGEPELGFSVFGGSRNGVHNGSANEQGRDVSDDQQGLHASLQRPARVSPPLTREVDKSLSASTGSTVSRLRVPPGAFHPEEEDELEHEHGADRVNTDEEGRGGLQTTPVQSSHRSTHTRRRSRTPRSTKATAVDASDVNRASRRTSGRSDLTHSIPGSLMDEDNDEHGRDDAEQTDAQDDEDTEMDEQEEEDEAVAPLPLRSSRRTRSSGHIDPSKSKKVTTSAIAATTATKGKAKARPSEVKTPARRSSRLSMASSMSPDHTDVLSPTKGRKSTTSRASLAGSTAQSGTVATRSSSRRKR